MVAEMGFPHILPSCGTQNPRALLLAAVDFDRYASSAQNSAYRFFDSLKKLNAPLCFLSPKKLRFFGTPIFPVSATGGVRVRRPGNPSVMGSAFLKQKKKRHPIGYLFLLVAEMGFEPHDLRVMSPTSYQAALLRDIYCPRLSA